MKQRVAIARALANRPRILLMDEPFGALDAQTRCQMQSYLLQIWKQVDITILFITHDLDEAVYLADRILVLDAHPGRRARDDGGAGARARATPISSWSPDVPRGAPPPGGADPPARRHRSRDKLPLVPHGRRQETTSNDRRTWLETSARRPGLVAAAAARTSACA